MPSMDDIAMRRPSLVKARPHLLQRTLSETVRHRKGEKNPLGCAGALGKHLSSSQFGMWVSHAHYRLSSAFILPHIDVKLSLIDSDVFCFYLVTLVWYMLSSCVCLSVHPSVTSRSSTNMVKPRITQTTPCDSPGTLVCRCQRSQQNSNGVTPNRGLK